MAERPRPSDEEMRRFVSKLEAFAAGLTNIEREMLRVALGIGGPIPEGDVRGYLSLI